MDTLTKIFKEKCKNEFSKYGFKTYRRTFYRVVNDVFQSFGLHKSVSGNNCTVEFCIVPLCAGDVIQKTYYGPENIRMFENSMAWYFYDRTDESSMENCVSEMIAYMKKYLIPFFEAGSCAKDAYRTVYTFQEKHYRKGVDWDDSYLFWMALKAEMYETALKHLRAQREATEFAYNSNKEHFEPSPEYTERIRNEMKAQEGFIRKIEERDLEYLEEVIRSNEQIALTNLGMLKK